MGHSERLNRTHYFRQIIFVTSSLAIIYIQVTSTPLSSTLLVCQEPVPSSYDVAIKLCVFQVAPFKCIYLPFQVGQAFLNKKTKSLPAEFSQSLKGYGTSSNQEWGSNSDPKSYWLSEVRSWLPTPKVSSCPIFHRPMLWPPVMYGRAHHHGIDLPRTIYWGILGSGQRIHLLPCRQDSVEKNIVFGHLDRRWWWWWWWWCDNNGNDDGDDDDDDNDDEDDDDDGDEDDDGDNDNDDDGDGDKQDDDDDNDEEDDDDDDGGGGVMTMAMMMVTMMMMMTTMMKMMTTMVTKMMMVTTIMTTMVMVTNRMMMMTMMKEMMMVMMLHLQPWPKSLGQSALPPPPVQCWDIELSVQWGNPTLGERGGILPPFHMTSNVWEWPTEFVSK